MEWELIITGCGTSHGSPAWGDPGGWSQDPRDHRRRSGAMLRGPDGQIVLIDCGPDLLHQLRDPCRNWDGCSYPEAAICRCDAVLLTHAHADHCHGINDLRQLNRLMGWRSIPFCAHRLHLDEVRQTFPYCFYDLDTARRLGAPALEAVPLADGTITAIAGLPVLPLPVDHGPAGRVTAFRIGDLAYITDVKTVPDTTLDHLVDADLLVLTMLREEVHPTHCNRVESLALIERLRPRRTVLVHLGHEVRYAAWQHRLPPGVELAVDGLSLPFQVPARH